MSQPQFLEAGDLSHSILTRSVSKLQKIQTLLRVNSSDFKQNASPILQTTCEILQKDPLLRTPKEIEGVVKQLSNINFFSNYLQDGCKSVIKAVIERGTLYTFNEGEFIYRKGDDSNLFYIILQGDVGIYGQVAHQKNTQNNTLIKVLKSGDSLGNIEITLNMKRFFSAEALSSGALLRIDKQTFNRYLRDIEEQKLDADFNFLENIQIFKGWSRDDLINIYIDCISYKYKYQEQVYSYGQPSHSIYIVKTGQFGVYKQRPYWFKQEEDQIENGIVNHQTCVKIGKLNVLDIFGYDDIFLNSERIRRVVCETRTGGELIVISKHNFITSILSHQPIKNYLIQKTKQDYFRPSKFIDDKPAIILGDNDKLSTELDDMKARQKLIKMSICNLSTKSTPKRGISDNRRISQTKTFARTLQSFQNQSQKAIPTFLKQQDNEEFFNGKEGEEKSVRPKHQTQLPDLGNPLSQKKLPFLNQLKDKSEQGDQGGVKLIIKENYYNRASAAYAHLFSHKLGLNNQLNQTHNKSTKSFDENKSQQANSDGQVNQDSTKLTSNLDQTKTNDLYQESTSSQQQQDPKEFQKQNSNTSKNTSGRVSTVTLFDSPIKPKILNDSHTAYKSSPLKTETQEINSPQKSFERVRIIKRQLPYSQYSSREDLDSLKQNHLHLSKHRFGNSIANLQQLDDLFPISSKNMLDNKFLSNLSPLSTQSFKKLSPIQFHSVNNLH